MNLDEAKHLCIDLMYSHGLVAKGWRFEWMKKRSVLGSCNHSKKTILLSTLFVQHNEKSEVRDVILHEIAHALVGRQPGNPHGQVWRLMAISIGARPERSAYGNIPGKYSVICPVENKVVCQRDRKVAGQYLCSSCHRRGIKTEVIFKENR